MIFEIGLRIVAAMLILIGVLDHGKEELAIAGCVLIGASLIASAITRAGRKDGL